MCYAIPAKLIEIKDNNIGVIDYFGEKRNILLDLDFEKIEVGDYVFAQGGVLVRKVPEKEALEILETWRDLFFELKKTDEALAKVDQSALPPNALAVLQQINLRKTISKKEIKALFELKDPKELSVLYEIANNVRQREHGNASCVHGIIEFSNYCTNNCFYCGIRKDKSIKRFRMTEEEIIATAKKAVDDYDFKALVLQSGEDDWYDDEMLARIVKTIRQMGVLVFLSVGYRSKASYEKFYEAGARAVLMRFETSNKKIFEKLRPGTSFDDRIQLIKELKEMGYVIATGFLMGLPHATIDDLINDILLTKSLAPDMFSFGPLIPSFGTPLEGESKLDKEFILKTIAITRCVAPDSNILVTTAMETLDKNAKREALLAGANSMMINLTPMQYRPLYAIYDNRAGSDLVIEQNIKEIVDLLYNLGRSPADVGL